MATENDFIKLFPTLFPNKLGECFSTMNKKIVPHPGYARAVLDATQSEEITGKRKRGRKKDGFGNQPAPTGRVG